MRYCQLSSFSHIYLDEYKEPKPSLLCSIRVLIALLSMLGTSIMYITRVNLNIAILAMVQSKDPDPALKTIEMLANSSEAIIFVFLGVCTVNDQHHWNTAFVALTIIFCLVYRTIGMFVIYQFCCIYLFIHSIHMADHSTVHRNKV